MNQYPSAAGIIVYRDDGKDSLLFLGLVSLPEYQTNDQRIYDIPKGRIDPGETPLQCAIREAKEEATIDITHLDSGPYTFDRLTVWLAESYQEPYIGINPETKMREHLSYKWVKSDQMELKCLDYLKPHIQWARKYLGDA